MVKGNLENRYGGDKRLLSLYRGKLLAPGWAGELDEAEYRYIRDQLEKDRRLRTRWGFVRGQGYRLSERRVREVAKNGAEGGTE